MKKTIIHTLAICMLYFIPAITYSQEQQESFPHRYIGLGIRVAGIQVNDLFSNAYPTNRLVLNIDAHKNFRIEGQYGIYNKNTEIEATSWGGGKVKLEMHDKSTFLGFGLMGLYPTERARFIGGFRYSTNNYSDDNIYYDTSGYPSVVENEGKITLITGIIGGEYFFAKFFSLGAEFSISSVKDVYKPSSSLSSSDPTTNTTIMTEGTLVFRFYPF